MPTNEEIEFQQELLTSHRRTLSIYLKQQALLGILSPPSVINGITDERRDIGRIKAILHDWGTPVSDHPDDAEPAVVSEINQVVGLAPAATRQQIRAPVRDFVGRQEEINILTKKLQPEIDAKSSAVIAGIRGLAGIGKSQFAFALAQSLTPFFPDAQILIEMRGTSSDPLRPELALQNVIRVFERDAQLPDNLPQIQAIYRATLAGKRVLLLADDARDAAQVQPLIPPPGCLLLVTSREHFALPEMIVHDIGTLSKEDAITFVAHLCPRAASKAEQLAQLCGSLPLALRISADILSNDPTLDIDVFLAQLADEHTRLSRLRNPDLPSFDVQASLNLSYTALDATTQYILQQLSIFPTSFDWEAIQGITERSPKSEHAAANPAAQPGSELPLDDDTELRRQLSILYRRSLLDFDNTTKRYSLHELVRVFAANRLSKEDRFSLRERHARYYLALGRTAAQSLATSFEHDVLVALDIMHPNLLAAQAFLLSSDEHEHIQLLIDLQMVLDQYYNRRGLWFDHVTTLTACIHRLRLANADPHSLGLLEIQLARLYRRQLDNLDYALNYLQEGLQRLYPEGAPPDAPIGPIYRHLGDTHRVRGDFGQALTYYQIAERLLPANLYAHERGKLMSSMADAYARSGIDLDKALATANESLMLQKQVKDNYEIIQSYRILADVHLARGEVAAAAANIQIAQRLFEADAQQQNPLMGWILRTLGDVQRLNQDFDSALASYTTALTLFRRQQIGIGIVVILKKMGQLYLQHGKIAEGIAYLRTAVNETDSVKGAKYVRAEALLELVLALLTHKCPEDITFDQWVALRHEQTERLTQLINEDEDLALLRGRYLLAQSQVDMPIGIATSVAVAAHFDPFDALAYAIEKDFRLLQVFLDPRLIAQPQLCQKIAAEAQQNEIRLICHAPGLLHADPALKPDVIATAHELLKHTAHKWVVYHFDEKQPLPETLELVKQLTNAGLTPCIENYHRLKSPENGRLNYQHFLDLFDQIAQQKLPVCAVIDIPRTFDDELEFSVEEATRITQHLFERLTELGIPIVLHLIDSSSFNLDRGNWCPVGEGVLPYDRVLAPVFATSTPIKAIVLEFEDKNNPAPSRTYLLRQLQAGLTKEFPTLATQWWG